MDHSKESKRLSAKVNSEKFVKEYLDKHLTDAKDILEVACGPGVILDSAANAFPCANFIGIDTSKERICDAFENLSGRANATNLLGNALYLPFQSECFDFVFTRFLLQYLPNPEDAVTEMVRVCKPGGKLLLQDLDGQLQWYFPEDKNLKAKIDKVVAYLHKNTGFDPFVGRKLFSFLQTLGLENIQVRADSYNLSWGKMDAKSFQLWETKLEIVIPVMIKVLGGKQEAYKLKKACLDYFSREDTLVYSVVFTVCGEKPLN
ncbi:methyltransferase domain-containing protein [Desulfococcaceae bacterium HSG7]|nr:methyltransferase domain-containing protein [Desulfococcaceae bacterium HSG7]